MSLNAFSQPQQIHIFGGYSLKTCSCEILTKVMNRVASSCRHCCVCVCGDHRRGAGWQANKSIMTTQGRKGKKGVSGVAGV